ncbi:MAG: DUF134 domain-containing protein [Deltaproteobacteria bacterium]|nr:DUF134 domain-containing protein [Deltaproteobacteria bacterium]
MVRPKKNRIVKFNPDVDYFKPRGIPIFDLDEVSLAIEEREAMRLADLLGLSHEEAGREMGVSRATFGRIVQRARKVVADALINGKSIKIEGGNYNIINGIRRFVCGVCKHKWDEPFGTGRPYECPSCKSEDIQRISLTH